MSQNYDLKEFGLINDIGVAHFQWSAIALSIMAVGVLINLDFHYILGGTIVTIGIVMLVISLIFSIITENCQNGTSKTSLLSKDTVLDNSCAHVHYLTFLSLGSCTHVSKEKH